MKLYRKFADLVLTVTSVIGVVCLIGVVVTAFTQVLARYVFPKAPTWTEEAARYFFLWMSMMGAPLASRHVSNAAIDLISGSLKGKVKSVHGVILHLMVIFLAILLIRSGFTMTGKMMMRNSPALGVPMGYIYLAIPLGCIGIAIQELELVIENLVQLTAKKEDAE